MWQVWQKMNIESDFRKKSLCGRQYCFLAIRPSERHILYTTGTAFSTLFEAQDFLKYSENGVVVRLHRRTVNRLKKMGPWGRAFALEYHMRNRPGQRTIEIDIEEF